METHEAASVIQSAFRGHAKREQTKGLLSRMKERSAFLDTHAEMTKRLSRVTEENTRLKKGLLLKADLTEENKIIAGDRIRKAWIRFRHAPAALALRDTARLEKAAVTIQRFFRTQTYTTKGRVPKHAVDHTLAVAAFVFDAHASTTAPSLAELDRRYSAFLEYLKSHQAEERNITKELERCAELRARLLDDNAVLGAGSRSFFKAAMKQVQEDLKVKRFWGSLESVEYQEEMELKTLKGRLGE